MSRRTPEVTQADIARAIRAMKAAGYEVRVRLTREGAIVEPAPKVDNETEEEEPEKILVIPWSRR